MCCLGDKLFFDKRDNTEFDLLTVNETSAEPPVDDGTSINSPRNLALEATFINHNFSQQVILYNLLKSGRSPFVFRILEAWICDVVGMQLKLSILYLQSWTVDPRQTDV